jgi:hypothetical protein
MVDAWDRMEADGTFKRPLVADGRANARFLQGTSDCRSLLTRSFAKETVGARHRKLRPQSKRAKQIRTLRFRVRPSDREVTNMMDMEHSLLRIKHP